jgi:PKD repeat protein
MALHTNKKNWHQLALRIVFFSLFILGIAGPSSADPNDNAGTIKGIRTCHDEIKSTKEKIKGGFSAFKIIPNFPNFTLITVMDADGIGGVYVGSGVTVTKNKKVSEFHAKLGMNDEQKIYFTGKFTLDPTADDPVVLKAKGNMFGIDRTGNCLFTGKFKSTNIALGNLPPLASFTATPQNGGAPLKVSFDASGSQDPDESTGDSIASYSWDFGDSGMSSGEMVEHTYPNPGSFTAELTVTDSLGLTGTTTVLIQALDVMAPVVTAPDSIIVPADDFSGTPGSDAAIAAFLSSASALDETDGAIFPMNDAPAVFPVGETVVTFWATDAGGNTSTAMASVVVTPLAVDLTLADQATVTQIIGPDGGALQTVVDGTKFALVIPPGALFEPVEIFLTPVTSMTGQPAGIEFQNAVQFKPEGLDFLKQVTLSIEFPSTPDPKKLIGLGSQGDGSHFHFLPVGSITGTVVQLFLTHFSVMGTVLFTGSTGPIPGAPGLTTEEAALQEIARLVHEFARTIDPEEKQVLLDLLKDWYTLSVAPNLELAIQAAISGPYDTVGETPGAVDLVKQVAFKFAAWWATVINATLGDELAGLIDEAKEKIRMALESIVGRANLICAASNNDCEKRTLIGDIGIFTAMAQAVLFESPWGGICQQCMGDAQSLTRTLMLPSFFIFDEGDKLDIGAILINSCTSEPLFFQCNTVNWSSNNSAVATVQAIPEGSEICSIAGATITAHGKGTAKVTAQGTSCSEARGSKAETLVKVFEGLSGFWRALGSETVTGCSNPADNGTFPIDQTIAITQEGDTINVAGIPGTVQVDSPNFDENGAVIIPGAWTADANILGASIMIAGVLTNQVTSEFGYTGTDSDGCSFVGTGTATKQTLP